MNYAISLELQLFLVSILWGAVLLLVYDCLRIFRRLIKHDDFFVALEDLIFWAVASLYIFSMMYRKNNGIIRGFSVMGMAIGMVIYYYIFSDFIINIITMLIHTLISPVCFALKKIRQYLKFIWVRVKKSYNFIIRQLKKYRKSVKIALNKRKQASDTKRQQRLQKKIQKKEKEDRKKESKKKESKKTEKVKKKKKKEKEKKKNNTIQDRKISAKGKTSPAEKIKKRTGKI